MIPFPVNMESDEALLQVTYDPSLVTYEELLKVFWRQIDPCTENGQGNDRGSQYRTGIYAHNAEQRHIAESSKRNLQIVTKMQDSEVGPVCTCPWLDCGRQSYMPHLGDDMASTLLELENLLTAV